MILYKSNKNNILITSSNLFLFLSGFTPEFNCKNLTKPLNEYDFDLPESFYNGTDYEVEYGKCEITISRKTVENITWSRDIPCPDGYEYEIDRATTFVAEVFFRVMKNIFNYCYQVGRWHLRYFTTLILSKYNVLISVLIP